MNSGLTMTSIKKQIYPSKRKMLRVNHAPHITKVIRKAVMKKSYLEKLYFKKRTPASMKNYHKNYCSKWRKKYFDSLNHLR